MWQAYGRMDNQQGLVRTIHDTTPSIQT